MIAGSLEIQLLANMARLQADMDQAKRSVGGAMDTITKSVKVAAGALAALGAGLSVSVFSGWIKGAINAADETSKLSQRIGVAVKDVAGLQLAFRQAGVGDAFATSMAKMAKSAADGSKAFDAMGISTRAADGTLKTTRQLLGEVADKMATYQDSAAKSALAQEIFGKSGAQLIPLLNAGSKGLDEYDAMAKKLGLTLDENTAKEAEKFNDTLDLIGQGTQGVARQISAQLLPTLTGLAGQFFDSMTSGDKLKKTADFLASALKVLYIAGLAVVEAFKTVGNVLGGVSAAVVAALAGDFGVAKNILKAIKTDVSESWKETAAQMGNAWTTTGNAAVESMAATSAAMKKAAPVAADMEKASKAAAKAAEDALKAAQKQWEELVKTIVKNDEATNKWLDQNSRTLDGLIEGNEALRQQNEAIGLNTAATDALTLSRMDAAIAQAQLNLIDAQNIEGNTARVDQIEREIRLLKERKELTAAGQVATAAAEAQKSAKEAAEKAAKEAADAWQKSADEINQSLTDALMDAFMAGKGFGKTFVDSIKAMFNSMVLKPVISAIVSPVASAVTGAMGFSGTASAASSALSGGSSLFSAGSTLAGVGSFMGELGTGLLASTQTALGMTATAAQASYAATMGVAAQTGSLMGSLGPLISAAPYLVALAGVYMLAKKLDHSGTPHTGGGSSYSAATGLTSTATGRWTGGTSWGDGFGSVMGSEQTNAMTAGIVQSVVGILDSTAVTFGKTAGYTAATAFADDSSKDGAWGSLLIKQMDSVLVNWADTRSSKWAPKVFADGDAGNQQYLAAVAQDVRSALNDIGLPAWASDMLNALGDAPGLDQLAATVAQINATQTALVAMGKNLVGFAAMSDTAVQALITASGGINTLAASASSYYDNFYTDAEKQAATMASLADGFAAINVAMPATRDEFRATVEALQAATGENPYAAPALASVLSMSAAFASVVPAAEAAGSTVVDTVEDMLTLGAALNALRNPVRTIEDVAKSLFGLEQDGASLQVELLSARGDTEGAKALQRSLDTAGFTDAEVALYDYNQTLQDQIDLLKAGAEVISTVVTAYTDLAAYQANFHTESERLAISQAALQTTFDALGLSMPNTNAGFRALVESQDLTTVSGITTFNTLMDVQAAFAGLYPMVQEVATAATVLTTDLSAFHSGFFTAAEQVAMGSAAMEDSLRALGVSAIPGTNESFRALVESVDTSTDSGKALFNGLISLSGAFAQLHPLVVSVEEVVESLDDALASLRASGANRTVQQIASNMLSLEEQVFQLSNAGDTAALRQHTLDGLSDVQDAATGLSERGLQSLVWSLQDSAQAASEAEKAAETLATTLEQAAAAAAAAAEKIAQEHDGLWRQWLTANEDTAALRALDLAALDPSNRALQLRIWAFEDEKTAAEIAAQATQKLADEQQALADAAAQAAKAIADQHDSLWRQWLTTTGDTAALRALDLAALDPSNRALQEQIWAYQDQKTAAEEATRAADSLKSAWGSLTDSLLDEVRRIRGVIDEASGASYASLQAQFAITTAHARAGDQNAAGLLPGLSQSLLTAAEASSATLVDLQRARALTANSLEQTAGLLGGGTATTNTAPGAYGYADGAAPVAYNPPPASTYGLADMVGELRAEIAALKDEVRGLRGEQKVTGETIAINTGKTARLNQKWDDVGLPITTETDLTAVYGA